MFEYWTWQLDVEWDGLQDPFYVNYLVKLSPTGVEGPPLTWEVLEGTISSLGSQWTGQREALKAVLFSPTSVRRAENFPEPACLFPGSHLCPFWSFFRRVTVRLLLLGTISYFSWFSLYFGSDCVCGLLILTVDKSRTVSHSQKHLQLDSSVRKCSNLTFMLCVMLNAEKREV